MVTLETQGKKVPCPDLTTVYVQLAEHWPRSPEEGCGE